MQKLIELIESAYCTEGDASATLLKSASTPEFLVFRVCGSSTCEHNGDEGNLRSQVGGLRGQSITEEGFSYTITNATLAIGNPDRDEEDEDGDGEYSVSVDGRVTVTKKQI